MSDYFDIDGTPLDVDAWAKRYEDRKSGDWWIVGKTIVGDAQVSTVWLGMDHNYGRGGPPMIFESMIFGGEHAEDMERYSTWEEATDGHAWIVACLRIDEAYEAR